MNCSSMATEGEAGYIDFASLIIFRIVRLLIPRYGEYFGSFTRDWGRGNRGQLSCKLECSADEMRKE